MTLLPPWRRRRIEHETKYFHALLEADADGDLVLEDDDWRGGLNALREDMEEINEKYAVAHQKALEELKTDIQQELSSFRAEVFSMLCDLSEDIKRRPWHVRASSKLYAESSPEQEQCGASSIL